MTVPKKQDDRKKTSLSVAPDLWEDLRVAAMRRKMTAGEAVEAALRLWMAQPSADVCTGKPGAI